MMKVTMFAPVDLKTLRRPCHIPEHKKNILNHWNYSWSGGKLYQSVQERESNLGLYSISCVH